MDDLAHAIQELSFPRVSGLAVRAVYGTGPSMRVEARCTPPAVTCPGCEQKAARVHSSYLRSAAGRAVTVALRVRRFFCDSAPCPRRTFVEQVPGLTRRHGQVTERLRNTLGVLGLALAGRAGSRMAGHLGVPFSRSTLLRRVMDLPDPAATAPRSVWMTSPCAAATSTAPS